MCAKIRKIINNSAANCSISLKFRIYFDYVTLNVPRIFKVIWYQHQNAIIQAGISCRRSNLVKIIPEPSTTCNAMFKVIRSNAEITITPPRIARWRSNLVQSFIMSQAIHCKCSRSEVKGQRSRSQPKVMYQQQKCYNTTMDRFSDFELGMAS